MAKAAGKDGVEGFPGESGENPEEAEPTVTPEAPEATPAPEGADRELSDEELTRLAAAGNIFTMKKP